MLGLAVALALPTAARAQSPVTIDGSPLNVSADGVGRLGVQFDGRSGGEFFDPDATVGDAGLELREGTSVASLYNTADRTPLSAPTVNGATIHSAYKVALPVPLDVAETVGYTSGTQTVTLHYEITNRGSAPVSFSAGELADLYLAGDDHGRGVLLPGPPRIVGGVAADGSISGLVETTPWSAYQESEYGDVFDDFDSGGLLDTVNPSLVDNGVGAEWDVSALGAGQTATIDVKWSFGDAVAVNTTQDHPDDGACNATDCTLREAIVHSPDGSTISVPGGLYSLGAPLVVSAGRHLTIVGASADPELGVRISGGGESQLLSVAGTLSVSGAYFLDGSGNSGGAIAVSPSGSLTLIDSEVADSAAVRGGGLYSQGALTLIRSTVARNRAGDGPGGGIYANGGSLTIADSTISGNSAASPGGGIALSGTAANLLSTTIAANANLGVARSGGTLRARNTIFSDGCDTAPTDSGHNLGAATCGLNGTDAELGELQYNGGDTELHPILGSSPAFDAGDPTACQDALIGGVDQRGAPRIQGAVCDIGSYEVDAAPLIPVVTSPADGSAVGSSFVMRGTTTAGATVTVVESDTTNRWSGRAGSDGTWAVVIDGLAAGSHTFTVSGAIGPQQSRDSSPLTVIVGAAPTPTPTPQTPAATATPAPSATPAPTPTPVPPPVAGKSVNVEVEGGTVLLKLPGSNTFVKLGPGMQIPVGTIVDVRHGRIGITAAADKHGTTASSDFYGGIFKLGQTRGAKPITTLKLTEALDCPRTGAASAAAKKPKKRRLWGDGSGSFRTQGHYSSATVRGTIWLVQDTCTTTLTRVRRGVVAVRDAVKHKTIVIKAGHSYTARSRRKK